MVKRHRRENAQIAIQSGNSAVTDATYMSLIAKPEDKRFEMFALKRLGTVAVVAGLASVGVAAMPHEAKAWWRGGVGVGIWVPPVVVAPPPVYVAPPVAYAPPPVYYPAPRPVWVPPHWEGPYWVRGHWA
jgi:hypothetical protein